MEQEYNDDEFEKYRIEERERFEANINSFVRCKIVSVRLDMYSETMDILKDELGVETHQQVFNKLIKLQTDFPDYRLIEKDYRRGQTMKQMNEEQAMARPKKNPNERKKSMSISVTSEEIERVQGVFKNFATGAIFLSNLMERLYDEGVIPDHIVKEEMDKLL